MATFAYNFSGNITKVTVGAPGSNLQAGTYDIVAYGGGGGADGHTIHGGKGAEIGGFFTLTDGEKLRIIAAGAGKTGAPYGGGGGGASQVFAFINGHYVPLLVAGGGGGAANRGNYGYDATVGSPGSGGSGNAGDASFASSGGGAGVNANGGTTAGAAHGGYSAANGAAGGSGASGDFGGKGGDGGFGGGGGGAGGGGGGGGFTGGNGGGLGASGQLTHGGYGGSSYVSTIYGTADSPHTMAGVTTADGKILFTPLCFAAGTLIRAARNGAIADMPVEALAVGDLAVTASGEARPIRWLGHRDLGDGTTPLPHDQRPVRISANAFGPDTPTRDLHLSPGHPVLVGADENGRGGTLVPIMCLINGTTIERVSVERITYWHIELDEHDILLAEGLPAESYLDWGDRAFFTECANHALINPDFVVPGLAGRCRPVAIDGPVVEAERRRLDGMFAVQLAAACMWPGNEDAMSL